MKKKSKHEERVNEKALSVLRREILKKNSLDPDLLLKNKEFVFLEEDIFKDTNVKISASTLRRFWGVVSSESKAKDQTLLVLSQYAGYRNWYQVRKIAKRKLFFEFTFKKITPLVFLISLLIFGTIVIINNIKPEIETNFDIDTSSYPVTFKLDYNIKKQVRDKTELKYSKVREGIKLYEDRSVIIEQVYKCGYVDAIIYYNDKPLKKKSFFVQTNGWKCADVYDKNKFIIRDLTIENGYLHNFPLEDNKNIDSKLIFYEEFAVDSEDFILEMTFILRYPNNGEVHKANIGIDFENSYIDFGFADNLNINKSHVVIGDTILSGLYYDLTKMKIENGEEYTIQVIKKNRNLKLVINCLDSLSFPFSDNIGRFEGFDFNSYDNLAIDNLTFCSGNDTIYFIDF